MVVGLGHRKTDGEKQAVLVACSLAAARTVLLQTNNGLVYELW